MKIQNINKTISSNINQTKQTEQAKIATKNITAVIAGISALSGIYIANQSAQKNELVQEISSLPDKTFYNHIKKHYNNIDKLKKFSDKGLDEKTFEMHAKTEKGETTASFYMTKAETSVYIMERNGLDRTIKNRLITKDMVVDTVEEKKRGKTVSLEKIIYDKTRNMIIRKQLDPKNKDLVLSLKQTTFSPEGIIDDVIFAEYNNQDVNNITTKAINKDYKNNATVSATNGKDYDTMYNLTRTYKNPLTGQKETIQMDLSDVTGVYNSTITDANGNKKTESVAYKNPDGSINVEKHFVSLDGTKTDYIYTASKNKNNIKMSYKITDIKGNALTTVDRTFKRINENLAISSVNGHQYIIEKTPESINITDKLNNKITNINLSAICTSEQDKEKISALFDKMSGDMILDFYNRGYKYTYEENNNRSSAEPNQKYIRAKDDVFIMSHEQGHTMDFIGAKDKEYNPDFKNNKIRQSRITSNPEIKRIFNEERKAFEKAFPDMEKAYINYLIDDSLFKYQDGNLSEAIAESSAMFSTEPAPTSKTQWARDYYFQKFFPKTIAAVSKFVLPNSNLYVGT